MMDDFDLSPHFSFFDLTATDDQAVQALNRQEGAHYLPSLRALSERILEPIRGDRPLLVNSAFRSFLLNKATAGSSPTSQHPLGQAADIHREGQSVDDLFAEIVALAKAGRLPFGQIIDESFDRGFKVSRWVHVSLGRDFWKPERCGEIRRINRKKDGSVESVLLEKIDVPEAA